MDTVLTAVATPLMWQPGILELGIIGIIFLLMVVLPLALIIMLVTRIGRRSNFNSSGKNEHILRDMNEGLQRMEERIEALETLLVEEKSKGRQK
jgi:phage shock protein B